MGERMDVDGVDWIQNPFRSVRELEVALPPLSSFPSSSENSLEKPSVRFLEHLGEKEIALMKEKFLLKERFKTSFFFPLFLFLFFFLTVCLAHTLK